MRDLLNSCIVTVRDQSWTCTFRTTCTSCFESLPRQAMKASKSSTVGICRCCLVTLIVTSLLMTASARPRESSPFTTYKGKYCELNELQQEICQKCAKITKSKYVYPMCCNEEEGVYRWCREYIDFGMSI